MTFSAPPGIDGDKLIQAIAVVETNDGLNSYPRFESGYAPKGFAATIQGRIVRGTGACFNSIVAERWKEWGMASACSFSKWQILAHTAMDLGFAEAPWLLWSDEVALPFVIKRLTVIRDRYHALTVADFADSWNSGTFRDKIIPQQYIDSVLDAYGKLG